MPERTIERQVRYNSFRSKRNPQRVEWLFLIVNDNRYIDEILRRIDNKFSPLPEEYKGLEGTIQNTKLRFKLVHFESEKNITDLWKIYTRMSRDTKLYDREDPNGLEKYVHSLFS